MKKDYAKMREEKESAIAIATDFFVPHMYEVVNCDKLNMRVAPKATAEVCRVLNKGDCLIELPKPVGIDCGCFILVRIPGDEVVFGYCMEDYLKVVK